MLDATVSRALSTEPERRFRSAAEMREALEAALREPERAPSRSRRKLAARGLASVIALSVLGLIGAVATRPVIREKAMATLAPVLNKAHALQASVAARVHAAHPENTALAQAEPSKADAPPAVVEVNAAPAVAMNAPAPDAVAPSAAAAPSDDVAPAAAAAPSDDGEVEDDSPSTDSAPTEKAAVTPGKADTSATGEAAIAEAHKLTAQGNKNKALNVLRHAAKKVPTDAKVLQELAAAAEEDRAWGEATRAARHWVEVAPSVDSKLELARLERKTGHKNRALELVRSVVKDNPDSPEARAMLGQLGGAERVALQK
jgi:tetratricopeptide (TPR) repeat protein